MRNSEKIRKKTEEENDIIEVFGWRLVEGRGEVGDILKPSFIHRENESGEWEPTEERHTGVSAFSECADMEKYATWSAKGYTLLLIGGDKGRRDENDAGLAGEVVIDDAEVFAVFNRESTGNEWA